MLGMSLGVVARRSMTAHALDLKCCKTQAFQLFLYIFVVAEKLGAN